MLQLLNCLKGAKPVPFPSEGERLIRLQSVQAAMLIDNARMYQSLELKVQERTKELEETYLALKHKDALLRKDLQRAHQMQLNILPQKCEVETSLAGTGLKLFTRFVPCDELGGDFWDMFVQEDGTVVIGVFDFAGHGVSAALNTFQMKSLFHQFETKRCTPKEMILSLNKQLYKEFSDYATGVVLNYSLGKSLLQVSRGGHPYPLLYRSQRKTVEEITPFGTGIGLFSDIELGMDELQLEEGDKVLIVTDGIYEAHHHEGDEQFGFEQLKTLFQKHAEAPAEEIYHAMMKAVREFTKLTDFDDDLFFLLLEKKYKTG